MKKIVVGLDGSARAAGVLAKALELTRNQDAQLVLVRSIGVPADIPDDLWRRSDESLIDILDRQAKVYLANFEERVPQPLRGGTLVIVGSPWQTLCTTARNLRADLIVVGSHGYSGVDRILGTTAAKVVNHAPCSVLVIRDDA